MTAPAHFGTLLRQHRVAAGISQEQLAELARLSAKTIGALERGERRRPYHDTIEMLGKALGLSAEARMTLAASATRRIFGRERLSGPSQPHALPIEVTRLIGRADAIGEVASLLRTSRLVTLVGTGGIGKTRLALAVARSVLTRYPDGVAFVELAALNAPELVEAAVAAKFGLREEGGRRLVDTLVEYLRRKRVLVVLDNCEHVIAAVATLCANLLRSCGELSLLATSREPLHMLAEQAWRVPALSLPDDETFEGLERSASGELFCERARAVAPGFVLRSKDAAAIAAICKRLDGLPLALELAAARMGVLTPTSLARELATRFEVLTAGDRTAPPRHHTLRATIAWSYDLLDERERALFRRIGIFVDVLTLDAAAAVCVDAILEDAAIFDTLASLVDKSLLWAEPSDETTRYRMLESTLAFAREKLSESGERERVAGRHARYMAELVDELTWDMWESPDASVVDELAPELENLRAALRWSFDEEHDVELGSRLTVSSAAVFRRFDLRLELEGRLEAVLRSPLACADARVEAGANYQLLYSMHTSPERQIVAGERAVTLYRQLGEDERLAHASALLAHALAVCFGRYDEARPYIDDALVFARANGTPYLLDQVLRLASQALPPEALAERRRIGRESLSLATASGEDRRIADALVSAAEVEFAAESHEAALRLGREALATQRRIANRTGLALQLTNVAAYALGAGRIAEAEAAAKEALPLAREVQSPLAFDLAIQHLASIVVERDGDAERAARLLGFVDARLAADGFVRETTERLCYERTMVELHARVSAERLDELLAEGRWLTPDRAIAVALGI